MDSRTGHQRNRVATREVEVEISRDQHRHLRRALPDISKNFGELADPELVASPALEVGVIDDERFVLDSDLAHQCHPASQSSLQARQRRDKPARTPEFRLLSKSENTG